MRTYALCIAMLSVLALSAQASDSSKLDQLRARAATSGWTFTIGNTGLLDVPRETITGFKRDAHWREQAPFVRPAVRASLPAHWDWRDKGVVTSIKNQHLPQYCGACWAFGTDAAIESAIALATGKLVDLSEQQLVSCQPSYGTCEGGDFAFGFYQSVGANHSADFPYVAADVPCKTDAPQHERITQWGYVGSELGSPSTDEIKQAIFQYGPIAATVAASDVFVAYKGGVYNACDSQDVNHIVSIIGWDDTDQAWIVKNSWGTDWGEKGFMRIRYTDQNGQKCNAIGDSAAFVTYKPTR